MNLVKKKTLLLALLLPLCFTHEAAPDVNRRALVYTGISAAGIASTAFCLYKMKSYNEQIASLEKNQATLSPNEIKRLEELKLKLWWTKAAMLGSGALCLTSGYFAVKNFLAKPNPVGEEPPNQADAEENPGQAGGQDQNQPRNGQGGEQEPQPNPVVVPNQERPLTLLQQFEQFYDPLNDEQKKPIERLAKEDKEVPLEGANALQGLSPQNQAIARQFVTALRQRDKLEQNLKDANPAEEGFVERIVELKEQLEVAERQIGLPQEDTNVCLALMNQHHQRKCHDMLVAADPRKEGYQALEQRTKQVYNQLDLDEGFDEFLHKVQNDQILQKNRRRQKNERRLEDERRWNEERAELKDKVDQHVREKGNIQSFIKEALLNYWSPKELREIAKENNKGYGFGDDELQLIQSMGFNIGIKL